ncbi:MAG TPA: hypothetical protein VF731_02060 [Solirubrobacterales bacterium]
MRALRLALAAALLTLAFAVPSASASTTIGQLLPPQEGGICGATAVQDTVETGTTPYAVPAGGGVITSWQTRTAGNAGAMTLKVFRYAGTAGRYQVIGEEGPHSIAANTSPIFSTGVRIPVQAGDLIGFYGTGTNCESYQPGKSGYHLFGFGPSVNVPAGTTATAEGGTTQSAIEIAATVEPDADHDGYGDETQDACPADPTAHLPPCPAPAPAPGPAPGPDTTAPGIALSSKTRQAALKKGAVIGIATVTEGATLKASGSVSIPNAGAFSLSPTTVPATAAVKTALPLGIPKAARAKIKAALGKDKVVKASIHVVATDAAGNASNATQSVRIVSAKPKH